jgi:hypothetical protein
VKEIVNAINGDPAEDVEESPVRVRNSAEVVTTLSNLLGVYGSPLHTPQAGPVIKMLAARAGEKGALGFALWKEGLKACQKKSVREWTKKQVQADDTKGTWVWGYPTRGGVRQLAMFVSDSTALGVVLDQMPLAGTEEAAEDRKRKMSKGSSSNGAETAPPPAPEPPVAQPTPTPAASEPEPLEDSNSTPPQAWDVQLRSAISLVLAEMAAVSVEYVCIKADGDVDFRRVQVTEGRMKVAPDGTE